MAQKKLEAEIRIKGKADSSLDSVASYLQGIANQVQSISTGAQKILEDSLNYYKDYNRNMLDAKGALSAQYESYAELEKVMRDLDSNAQTWAATSIFHTSDISKAISEAAHAGWDYTKMVSGIPSVMKLAQAGGYELSTALDQVIKVTNASGTEFSDLGGVVDMWTLAANKGATTVEEMGEAMTRMGATVQFAGGMDQAFTMLTLLANMGTVGTEAGTLLRNTMLRLVAPTKKAADAMADLEVTDEESASLAADAEALAAANEQLSKYGFSVYNEKGELKDMTTIFSDLASVVGEMNEQEANTLLSTIFPTRTITGAMNLIKAMQNGSWIDTLSQMSEAGGYAGIVSDIQNSSYANQIELFTSKIEALETKIGEIASVNVIDIMKTVGGLFDSINSANPAVLSALTGALEGLAAIGPVSAGIATIATVVAKIASSNYAGVFLGAAAITAFAAGVGLLYEVSKQNWSDKFGSATVDAQSISDYIDTLTAPFSTGTQAVAEAAKGISDAQATYLENLTMLTGLVNTDQITKDGELDPATASKYRAYGKAMCEALYDGVGQAEIKNLSFLNSMFDSNGDGDAADDLTESEYSVYGQLYAAQIHYWETMKTDVTAAIDEYNAAVSAAIQNGWNDETKRAYQEAIDNLNEYNIAMLQAKADQALVEATMAGKNVSWDSIQSVIASFEEARDAQIAVEKANYNDLAYSTWKDFNLQNGSNVTFDDWLKYTATGQALQAQYQQVEQAQAEYYGKLINEAIKTLIPEQYQDVYDFLNFMSGENGVKYYDERVLGEDYVSRYGKQLAGAYYLSNGYDLYNTSDQNGLYQRTMEFINSKFGTWLRDTGMYNFDTIGEVLGAANNRYYDDLTTLDTTLGSAMGFTLPEKLSNAAATFGSGFSNIWNTVSGAFSGGVKSFVRNPVDSFFGSVSPGWMTAGNSAANSAASGSTASIPVTADTSDVSNKISSIVSQINNTTATMRVNANVNSGGSLSSFMKRFATGGRATEASIFGEAGAEWAIPEEHSARTADLLDSARKASGFTWGDLIARTGGLNARTSSSGSTFVFSPTINANDSSGIEDILARSGDAMKRWWKKMQTKDSMEVYV